MANATPAMEDTEDQSEVGGNEADMEFDIGDGFELVQNRRKRNRDRRTAEKESSDEESGDNESKKIRNKGNYGAHVEDEDGNASNASNQDRTREAEERNAASGQPRGSRKRPQPARAGVVVSPSHRVRLLFPAGCTLNYHEKLHWTVTLGRTYRRFEPLLKDGRNRPYVTVGSQEAVDMLTTSGYKGIVLTTPGEREKLTKVLVFRYPQVLDPEFILDDPRFVWAKRHVVKGEETCNAVALVKGEVPDKVFITGAGYRWVAPYIEDPIVCLRCCRWGHRAWRCQNDPRCRFCARKHHSSVCAEKIKKGTIVARSCCNCGNPHNANYTLCPARPEDRKSILNKKRMAEAGRTNPTTPGEGDEVYRSENNQSRGERTAATSASQWGGNGEAGVGQRREAGGDWPALAAAGGGGGGRSLPPPRGVNTLSHPAATCL